MSAAIDVLLAVDDDEQWGRVCTAIEAAHPGVTVIPVRASMGQICTDDVDLREAIEATIAEAML